MWEEESYAREMQRFVGISRDRQTKKGVLYKPQGAGLLSRVS